MKLTPSQLKKIIIEELRHLREEDDIMTDGDVDSILSLLSDDFLMGIELLQTFKHKNLSPELEVSIAQVIWRNTTGFWTDPEWVTLKRAHREAEEEGFHYKIAPMENALNSFNAAAQAKMGEFADMLGMSSRDLWDVINVEGIDTLQKFQQFLKKQGIL